MNRHFKMTERLPVLFLVFCIFSVFSFCGCTQKNTGNDPVSLTIWHVYGEQSNSPMDELIHEFNTTTGKEKGITVTTTNITSVSRLYSELSDSLKMKTGSMKTPDLVTCTVSDVQMLGVSQFLNWNHYFSKEEKNSLVPEFLESGMLNHKLFSLPVIRSASVLFLNADEADRFFQDTGMNEDDLKTWDGFFRIAEQYHAWSKGKSFCSIDFLASFADLYAMDLGMEKPYDADGWYEHQNKTVRKAWETFLQAYGEGWITIPDTFGSQDVMTSHALSSLGSSAGILYYNDTVTDEDGRTEPLHLKVYPAPYVSEQNPHYVQGGVGLCAIRSTDQKAEAESVFAHWLLKPEHNMKLAAETGYMPASTSSFKHMSDYDFQNDSWRSLFNVMHTMSVDFTPVSVSSSPVYFQNANATYQYMRAYRSEKNSESFAEKVWNYMMTLSEGDTAHDDKE